MFLSPWRPGDDAELDRLISTSNNPVQRDRFRAILFAINGEQIADIQHAFAQTRGFVQRRCYTYRDLGFKAIQPFKQTSKPTTLPTEQDEVFKQRVLDRSTEDDGVCAIRGRDMRRILAGR